MSSSAQASKEDHTIVFVYNVDSGLFNALLDYAHKIVSPKPYACNLCAVTYDNTGMKKEWKPFIDNLGIPVEFLHREEFLETYPAENVHFTAAYRNQPHRNQCV